MRGRAVILVAVVVTAAVAMPVALAPPGAAGARTAGPTLTLQVSGGGASVYVSGNVSLNGQPVSQDTVWITGFPGSNCTIVGSTIFGTIGGGLTDSAGNYAENTVPVSGELASVSAQVTVNGQTTNICVNVAAGSSPTPKPACPDDYVIDSRGSGEDPGTISPPGAAFVGTLQALLPGRTVKAIANAYPARGGFSSLLGAKLQVPAAYFNSVNSGKVWLAAQIRTYQRKCPHANVILTGYSQGAQVTGDVVQRDGPFPNVQAVILFGDPYFNGRDPVDRGNPRFRTGVNGGLGVRPRFVMPHVLSYCHSNDPVCQNTANPIALSTWHKNYQSLGEPQQAAGIVARWVG